MPTTALGSRRRRPQSAVRQLELALVQLAVSLGGKVTTLSSMRDFDLLSGFGAVGTLDYRRTRPEELGLFDVIVDTVGRDLLVYRRHLARGGRMVAMAAATGSEFAAVGTSVLFGSRRLRAFSDNPLSAGMDEVSEYVRRGVFRPVVGPVYALEDIADAHRSLTAGGVTGKRVVAVDTTESWT